MPEFQTSRVRRLRPPSLRTFAQVMLGTRIIGFVFSILWATDPIIGWKLLVVLFTGTLVALQVRRLRALDQGRAH